MDQATEALAADASPLPGSISICAYCGEIAVFGEDMHLRPPTHEEHLQIARNPTVIQAQILIRGMPNRKIYARNKNRDSDGSDPATQTKRRAGSNSPALSRF
jgi:hypothetical protein